MAHPVRSRAFSALAFALVTPMLLAACGGEEKKAEEESPAEVMATAKKHFDDASSVHIALSTESTPSAGNGVLAATGTSRTTRRSRATSRSSWAG